MARWLHILQAGGEYWNPLRPDPLADQLLADLDMLCELVLNLRDRAWAAADSPSLDRLLTEVTRASAAVGGAAWTALAQLLDTHLDSLLDAALERSDGPLPTRLLAALQQAPAPSNAAAVVDKLPQRSTTLAELAAEITRQAVEHHRQQAAENPGQFLPDLASGLNNLSGRLADLGRHEDASTTAAERAAITSQSSTTP